MTINQFQLLSKYRTPLMGLSILWVMLFHSYPKSDCSEVLSFIVNNGYGGVDVFLFLSGFGLYYSSLKKESVFRFYAKRFIRIYPAYFIVALIFCFSLDLSFWRYLTIITTADFWIREMFFDWYVPALLILYFLFPFYVRIFNKKPIATTIIVITLAVSFVLVSMFLGGLFGTSVLFFSRIPIFVIGIFVGKLSLSKNIRGELSLKITLYILSLVGWFLLYYFTNYYSDYLWKGLHWLPFILITPGMCMFICTLFEKLHYKKIFWYRRLGRRDISIFGKWKKDFIWEQTQLNFTDASRAMKIVMNIYQN